MESGHYLRATLIHLVWAFLLVKIPAHRPPGLICTDKKEKKTTEKHACRDRGKIVENCRQSMIMLMASSVYMKLLKEL